MLGSTDAGAHWFRTLFHAGDSISGDSWCTGSVDGLSLGARGVAFLLIEKRSFAIGERAGFVGVWKSGDFGRSWRRIFWSAFVHPRDDFINYDGPYLLGGLVMLFQNSRKYGPMALFSQDGGLSWSRTKLAKAVSGCAQESGRLICASYTGGFGLAVIEPL